MDTHPHRLWHVLNIMHLLQFIVFIYAALVKDRWIFVCAFCLTHFQVSRPSKHVDNVDGLVTDGSCVCCQLCVSRLYQNKKLGPQLRLAVTV